MTETDPLVQFFINDRRTPEEVRKSMLIYFSADQVNDAYEKFREIAGSRKYLTPPPMLVKSKVRENEWYIGGDEMPGARFWPSLKQYLRNTKNWECTSSEHLGQTGQFAKVMFSGL